MDAWQVVAGVEIPQQLGGAGVAFSEYQRVDARDSGIGQDLPRHGLGLMAAEHHLDRGVEAAQQRDGMLIGRRQKVEPDPPRRCSVDEFGGGHDAEP